MIAQKMITSGTESALLNSALSLHGCISHEFQGSHLTFLTFSDLKLLHEKLMMSAESAQAYLSGGRLCGYKQKLSSCYMKL